MRLKELTDGLNDIRTIGDDDPEIVAITCDSRDVKPGTLFVAVAGNKDDGTKYINDAIKRGAVCVLCENDEAMPVPTIVSDNVRLTLGKFADNFYHHPSRGLRLIGITGTNGKTTVAFLIRHILRRMGIRTGMLGTIEYDDGEAVIPAPLTTPDPVTFTSTLARMRDNGVNTAVAEVSSHALLQGRVGEHRFQCGVFTNLSRDHLDYHGAMDNYAAAKKILFDQLDRTAWAVVNADDPYAEVMVADTKAHVCRYGLREASCFRGNIVRTDLAGSVVELCDDSFSATLITELVGGYNVSNCLAAIEAVRSIGVDRLDAIHAIDSFAGVPGRLERISGSGGVVGFVDYAHTDDALHSVISVLRPLVTGKLITVFGCGGDRDTGKRPLMAAAAEEGSDLVVVTSDNPRTEDPEKILADIMAGFSDPRAVIVELDRAKAVTVAVEAAGSGDVILLAGKGHEDYQILAEGRIHLDDRELLESALSGAER